jgi:hypothetical protein
VYIAAVMCDDPPEVNNGEIMKNPGTYNPGEETSYKCKNPYIVYQAGNANIGNQEFTKVCAIDYDTFTASWIGNYACDGKSRVIYVLD